MKKTTTNWLPRMWRQKVNVLACALLLAGVAQVASAQVLVGTGTSTARFPFSFWYGYSRNATIYTAGEMNTATTAGTITTLAWYSDAASSITGPVVIYLKAVGTTTAVASDTWANTISGATQVYTGTPANWTAGWNTLDITDFPIPAGQNIEVLIECNFTGSGNGNSTGTAFRYTTAGTNNHAYWQSDTNPPTGTPAQSTSGAINNNRPNITFGGLVPPPMTFVSTTTTQASSSSVIVGATNQQILGIQAVVTGVANPLALTQLTFNTTGTNNAADIANAKVYYTGTSSTFATTTAFGTPIVNPNGTFTVNGSQALTGGPGNTTNYFWLTYDVACTATPSNALDAQCTSVNIDGAQTPTATDPSGNRTINAATAPSYTATTSTNVVAGTSDLPMGRAGISGSACANTVTQVKFNTATTPAADLSQAKCYYTTSTTFATTTPFGTPVAAPNGDITFTGAQALASGSGNYFWLAYDVACSATVSDSLTAIPVSITADGNTSALSTPATNAKKGVTALVAPSYTATTATSTPAGSNDVAMGRTNIVGNSCATTVTEVKFNTATSPAADISRAKCYYTTSTTFGTATAFGSPVISPSGDIVFTGSQALASGSGNYFWLAYDLPCNAVVSDSLSAVPVSITANATMTSLSTPASNPKKGITALTGFNTVADGDWANPAIWSCGSVPDASTAVLINHNITVTTSGNTSGNITIAAGKTLTISSGELTMGPAGGGNRTFTNNGILTVDGGNLNLNGNAVMTANSTVNQSGGNINIDGNAGGVAANSVASGTYILNWTITTAANINLTGGTITVVDPHVATTNTVWMSYSPTGSVAAGPNHTFRFGDGVSTDPGGANGFAYYSWNGSGIFKFGKAVLESNTANAATRFVNLYNGSSGLFCNFNAISDVVINSGAELRQVGTAATGVMVFSRNLTVNAGGTLTSPGIVYFGDVTSSGATTLSFSASTNAQVISGDGTFRNATTSPTANFAALTINNTNTAGVTFANANSLLSGTNTGTVSGTLTMTAGIINTSSNSLVVGISSAAAGSYSYSNGVVIGKLKRWVAASTGSTVFNTGDAAGAKTATINFTTAPTAAGSLTAEWVGGDPGANGLPITEGPNNLAYVSTNGYWRITAGDGLAGGTYTATFNGVNVADVSDYTKLTIGKRANAAANWSLDGTYAAPTGSNTNFTISRTGITTGFSEFGILMGSAPLPVTLESFSGKNAGSTNTLTWKTAEEKNFSHFELLRSADGKDFDKLAAINASGNATGGSYAYTDERPFDGKNFYRLRIIDMDGKADLSDIVQLMVKSGSGLAVSIHPNPVAQQLHINIDGKTDGKGQIQVLDITGKVLRTVPVNNNSVSVDMSQLPAGTYMIRYADNSHQQVRKVTKN